MQCDQAVSRMQAGDLPRSTSTPAVRFSLKSNTRLSRELSAGRHAAHPFEQVHSACLPGLKLFSFVSVCVFARLWDISSHQPGWLDRCNLLSCIPSMLTLEL